MALVLCAFLSSDLGIESRSLTEESANKEPGTVYCNILRKIRVSVTRVKYCPYFVPWKYVRPVCIVSI